MATNTPLSPTTTTTTTDDPTVAITFENTKELLLYLYADLTRLSRVASPEIILHRFTDPSRPLEGIAAAQAHEEALVAATGGTLVMEVESVVANAHFGAVLGVLRAKGGDKGREDLAVPFCGLWRFDEGGRPVEHWENADGDPVGVAGWFGMEAGGGGGMDCVDG